MEKRPDSAECPAISQILLLRRFSDRGGIKYSQRTEMAVPLQNCKHCDVFEDLSDIHKVHALS